MEDNWRGIKEALTSTCQEVLGLKKHHHKEWISTETLDKTKERKNKKTAINNSRTRAEKVQAQAEYMEANKQVKKSIRADKKKYVEELATTAEKAASEGNMKQLYDTTKKLAGKYRERYENFFDTMEFLRRLSTLPELIRRTTMQCRTWRTADRCIPSKEQRQTGLVAFAFSLSSGGRLDYEGLDM
ncbi:unnamed protein product [Schistosoma mattheei]|uniref:Uncharacterized protein n=1 Tax=Schistosoma mattheei TaxID=31246 RepID=A0A183PVU2_9TREM|nr:unnamed protein product [Schistosoma mattheei]